MNVKEIFLTRVGQIAETLSDEPDLVDSIISGVKGVANDPDKKSFSLDGPKLILKKEDFLLSPRGFDDRRIDEVRFIRKNMAGVDNVGLTSGEVVLLIGVSLFNRSISDENLRLNVSFHFNEDEKARVRVYKGLLDEIWRESEKLVIPNK